MANILKIKNEQGEWIDIPSIKGDVGPQGPQGPQGPKGDPGEVPNNLVTTDTNQTITGNKTFTGTLQAASLSDGTTTKTMTEVISGSTEEWTFTLSDGTTVTKKVKLGE